MENLKTNEMTNRNKLIDIGCENSIVFENPDFDSAIIGTTDDDRVAYSFDKMVEYLMDKEDMDYEDAVEFIEYNTIRSLPYVDKSPIIIYNTSVF